MTQLSPCGGVAGEPLLFPPFPLWQPPLWFCSCPCLVNTCLPSSEPHEGRDRTCHHCRVPAPCPAPGTQEFRNCLLPGGRGSQDGWSRASRGFVAEKTSMVGEVGLHSKRFYRGGDMHYREC